MDDLLFFCFMFLLVLLFYVLASYIRIVDKRLFSCVEGKHRQVTTTASAASAPTQAAFRAVVNCAHSGVVCDLSIYSLWMLTLCIFAVLHNIEHCV
jgi:hypothetical protein